MTCAKSTHLETIMRGEATMKLKGHQKLLLLLLITVLFYAVLAVMSLRLGY